MSAAEHIVDLAPISDRYRVGRVVAQGGSGTVYFAERRSDRRTVALKAVPFNSPTSERRWLREVSALSAVCNPRLAELIDFGTIVSGRSAFIATRFVSGLTVEHWLESRLVTHGAAGCSIVLGTLDALHTLHEVGMAHRDVKATNVLLNSEVRLDEDDPFALGRAVVLVDFGIARSFSSDRTEWSRLTRPGVVVGTVDYLAPERIQGEPGDARADIWSVGVLLHRLVFGYTPFQSGVASQTLVRAVTEPLTPPWRALRDASPAERAIFEVVATALAKEPSVRFADAAQMRTAMVEAMRVGRLGSVVGRPWGARRDGPTGPVG